MADFRHVVLAEPLPGVVIVQIRDAPGVGPTAAEFTNVMAERGCAHQRQIDRKARLGRQKRRMHGDVVHADGMTGGVERLHLPADAHERRIVAFGHGAGEQAVFLRHAAVGHGVGWQRNEVGQRVKFVAVLLQHAFQHRQIRRLSGRKRWTGRIFQREHPLAQPVVDRTQKCSGIGLVRKLQHAAHRLQRLPARVGRVAADAG